MNLIGMMWLRNEVDIIEETVRDAATKVDHLLVADGHSTDGSWEVLQSIRLPNVELLRGDETNDRAQRQAMLDLIRSRHKPEDTWVQVIESDMLLLVDDLRRTIREHRVRDVAVPWISLNAVRLSGTWSEVDTYPNWSCSMRELMPYAHRAEIMTYSFRPLPGLYYINDPWRPWPRGFAQYTRTSLQAEPCGPTAPLLLHVGYRGPRHFHAKYRHMGKWHTKYYDWRLDSPENVERTVPYFNGAWNGDAFPATREGWLGRKK